MPASEYRTLSQAFALSIAAHVVLLIGFGTVYRLDPGVPAAMTSVVIARIKPVEPLKSAAIVPDPPQRAREPTQPPPSPRKAEPVPTAVPPQPVPHTPAPQPVRIAVREPSPVSAPTSPPSTNDVATPTPLANAPASPPSAHAVGRESPEPQASGDGVNADELRRYRVALASAARRFKRYPAVAREQGWEGTVEVAIRVNSVLPAPEVVLVRSSGRELLDEQALQMMTQAARATTPPEGLRGRDFEIPLPVRFSLDE